MESCIGLSAGRGGKARGELRMGVSTRTPPNPLTISPPPPPCPVTRALIHGLRTATPSSRHALHPRPLLRALCVVLMCSAVLAQHGDLFVTAAARELQGSALSVCADIMFAGRTTLDTGGYHTCYLSAAGAGRRWGDSGFGQVDVPASASSNQVAVSAGWVHTCFLSSSGTVACWGSNSFGQSMVPTVATTNQTAVSAGDAHTCSLSMAGAVSCWGYVATVPANASSSQVAVSAGTYHVCSLSAAGAVMCWGDNNYGQSSAPAAASYDQVAVAAGGYHACSLSIAGRVVCWGVSSGTFYFG